MSTVVYLYDGTNTLELDNECTEIKIGGNTRRYKFIDYLGQSGSQIRGTGSYSNKKIIVTHKEYTEGADTNAWNSRKIDFEKFFTYPVWKPIWLYVVDGEGSVTVRTQVYCTKIPDFRLKFLKVSDNRSFEIVSKSGIFESTSTTTDTLAITGSTEQTDSIVVTGSIEAWPIFSYTPTGSTEDKFRVKLSENYLFELTHTGYFNAGIKVSYDMSTGLLTFGGARVIAGQYLSKGSPFSLPVGTSATYVKCSGAGTFEWSYKARYV